MRAIAIDWSGARQNAGKTIWLAEARDGRLVRLENGRDREAIADHLIAEGRRDPALVVGFDFAFSLPAWFLDERGLAGAPDLWALAVREGEGWLRACAPPFWGRPGKGRPPLIEQFRWTDRAVPKIRGIAPKSVFQIGGAGAVGTGSLRGMPTLRRLQDAGFAIWPFDPPSGPRVVEIYPRLLTGKVVKSDPVERAAHLTEHQPDLPGELRRMASDDDSAFDAALSALVMAEHLGALAALPALASRRLRREGIIWHPRWREDPAPQEASPPGGD